MASTLPVAPHLLPDSAGRSTRGELTVAGVTLSSIADEFGTPFFLYDEAHLRSRCREAVGAFGEGVAYATKAFLCKAMAALATEEGMALDVATGGELAVALAAGVDPSVLVLHGNNKSDEELAAALDVGIGRIIVDSFEEIARLADLVAYDAAQHVSLRVTPGVEAHTHEFVMTGQEDSKFGFSVASGRAAEALAALRKVAGLVVDGVHAHIGSQIFRLDAFEREVAVLAPFIAQHSLVELSVGGGLGVAYLNEESAPSISAWAEVVRGACLAAGVSPTVVLSAEPGRAIVATAGLTCYRVGTIKELPGIRTYLAVDGGMSDNPRPVLYGSGYEAFLPREPDADRPLEARIVGKHCESGDVLVHEAHLPADVTVGDLLVTPVTGAYGFSMASNYNRLARPPVLFASDGDVRVVVRRERIEDLLRLEP